MFKCMMSGTMKFFSLLILYCTRKVSQVLILSSKPCRLVKFSPEFGPFKASLSSKWLKYFTLLKIDLPLFYQVNYASRRHFMRRTFETTIPNTSNFQTRSEIRHFAQRPICTKLVLFDAYILRKKKTIYVFVVTQNANLTRLQPNRTHKISFISL